MKIIKNIVISSLCLFSGSAACWAQTALPDKVEAFVPSAILKPLIYESDIKDLMKSGDWGQSKTPRQKKHWVVYSDRSNNTTYASPSLSTPFGKLDFNDKVIIAKIENGFALVYTDPKFPGYPKYSEKAESKGWIPMENLLLWQSCPADTKGIYQKALLAANTESKANDYLGYCYKNPVAKDNPTGIKTDMTFYYVMKTDAKSGLKLLANQARLDGNTEKVLYGWVDKNSYSPWNQRSCLEPNWKPSDVAHLNNPEGKPYSIYADPAMTGASAMTYTYGLKNPDDTKKSTQYRMNRFQTRYPILDQDPDKANPNIYKCTIFGLAGRSLKPQDNTNKEYMEKLLAILEQIKHINIIFVIDGTRSMNPYFASVKEAIKRGISYFDPNKFTLRVGTVVYRDYADGEFLIEKVPLGKADSPQLLSFLDTAGKYGATSSDNDRTNTEALYKGLEVASDPAVMGFSKDQSTIIVVVGDCGNDPNDTKCLTSEQIIDRMANNNIQLVSFQVENRPSEAWGLFNEQMCDIVGQSLTKQYKKLKANSKPRFKSLKNGYDFTSNANVEFFIGAIRYPEGDNGRISTSLLATLIEENIGQFAETIQKQIEVLINKSDDVISGFSGSDNKDEGGNDIEQQFLIDRIGEKLYKRLKEQGATVAFTGYVPKKDSHTYDLWKPVAFMSSEEFGALMERLGALYNTVDSDMGTTDRKPYVDAVKALIRVMVPDITEKDMDEMGISEVMRLAAGLNESSDAVKGRSLIEIQDSRVVPDDEYITLINSFRSKYKSLRDNIQNNPKYQYSFQTPNGQKFYWIPVEDLP